MSMSTLTGRALPAAQPRAAASPTAAVVLVHQSLVAAVRSARGELHVPRRPVALRWTMPIHIRRYIQLWRLRAYLLSPYEQYARVQCRYLRCSMQLWVHLLRRPLREKLQLIQLWPRPRFSLLTNIAGRSVPGYAAAETRLLFRRRSRWPFSRTCLFSSHPRLD